METPPHGTLRGDPLNHRQIILFGVVVLVLTSVLILGGGQDGEDAEPPEEVLRDVFLGPDVNDITMGHVEVVAKSYDAAANTIEYRAVSNPGYRFTHWTFDDGREDSSEPVAVFAADKDRLATAHFIESDVVSVEYGWYVPSFTSDGVVYGDIRLESVVLRDSDYRASLSDTSHQRSATASVPSPVVNCSADGPVADIVAKLNEISEGMTNLQRAFVALAFVQDSIGYMTDSSQYGCEEYWTTPLETLYAGYGDCEDTATLFVSIASAMGIDCGFVMFEHDRFGNPGTGHMSVAIALKDGENISAVGGAATFTIGDVTYAYAETAVDPQTIGGYHPAIGVLSNSYSLSDGRFTPITYDADTGGFSAGSTVAISNGAVSTGGASVYGDFSNPPAVEMSVGDTFSYHPETSIPATITANGDGLVFLSYDDQRNLLYGTADRVGTFTVTLKATSTVGPEQYATQVVTLIVTDSEGDGNVDRELSYGGNGWTVTVSGEDMGDTDASVDAEGDDDRVRVILIVAIIASALILMVGRRVQ